MYCKLFSLDHDLCKTNSHKELVRTDSKASQHCVSDQTTGDLSPLQKRYYIYYVINNLEKKKSVISRLHELKFHEASNCWKKLPTNTVGLAGVYKTPENHNVQSNHS